MKIFNKILFSIIVLQFSFSQSQNELNLFRLAQSFERAGEYERALKVYEELYRTNPANRMYLEAVVRLNTLVKNFDRAIELAKLWLDSHPDDVDMMAKIGDVYFKAGREREAIDIWDKIIRKYRDNPGVYRMVVDYMIQNRLYEKAVEYLLKARKVADVPDLYAYEIAMLYEFMMQFDKAVEEYINMLKRRVDMLPMIQSRMSAYIFKPEAIRSVLKVLENETSKSGTNYAVLELYAWVLMEAKDYQRALDVYRRIDRAMNANGEVIFRFAQNLFKEKNFIYSAKAFKEVIDAHPNFKLIPEAKLGYIESLDEIFRERFSRLRGQDTTLFSELRGIEAGYNSIVSEYSGTRYEAEALFRLGLLKLDVKFDLDSAEKLFAQIERNHMLTFGIDAIFKLAEIYTMKGELDKAREKYNFLLSLKNFPDTLRVRYLIAQLDYFEGDFNSALKILNDVVKYTSSDYANDAIELLLKIQTNRFPGDEPLRKFAQAELKVKQKRFGDAILILEDIKVNCRSCAVADEAYILLAKVYVEVGRFDKAIETLDVLLSENPESIYVDDALMEKGKIYQERLGNRDLAIQAFEKLLSSFPNSIYVNEARKRIRELRGEIQ